MAEVKFKPVRHDHKTFVEKASKRKGFVEAYDALALKSKNLRPAKKRVEVSVGESVRIMRKLQELSQRQLSELTGIPHATISAIENGRVNLGVERAKVLARALNCHPAVLVFSNWEVPIEHAA